MSTPENDFVHNDSHRTSFLGDLKYNFKHRLPDKIVNNAQISGQMG